MTETTRVLMYVQHLLGIGHLTRSSRIAAALVAQGAQVTMVTGGLPVTGFPGPGVAHVALPAVVGGEGFIGLLDADKQPIDEAFRAARRDMLLATLAQTRPHVVLTEAFPFGRRQMRFELLPLIDAIAAMVPRPVLCASVRDILQARPKPERDVETADLITAHYDHVLVHGDPAFVRLQDTFPLTAQIADKVIYTGLVAAPVPEPAPERYDVIVSAGGGAVGAGLLSAALDAAERLPGIGRWCVIAGPNMPQTDFDGLANRARPGVDVVRFRPDFVALLGSARLSVSQAGYNTVCDILGAGCRAVLAPYSSGGETEQKERADRLARLGLVTVLPEHAVDGARMADAIMSAFQRPAPESGLRLNGAEQTALTVMALRRGSDPDQTLIT